jgi:hypothetical protein
VAAGLAQAPGALAQIYKCTDADGRTAFSDKPCATAPGAAGSAATGGAKQETLRQPKPAPGSTSADATSAMCAKHDGSKATDAMIQSLPEKQRQMVISALRGVVAGGARSLSLHIDASKNAIVCVPRQRGQGAPPAPTTYVVHRIEPNGRMETLQPGAAPLVYNDANEPMTVAARCAGMITSCVRSKPTPGASLDDCFEKQPVCPAGRLDPAASCCPQACKDAYRRERSRGTDAETATIKVMFGDDAGAVSCVPGMPKRG